VRQTAVWISESYLQKNDEEVLAALSELKEDDNIDVRIQLLLSLSKSKSQDAADLSAEIVRLNADNEMIAGASKSLLKTENIKNLGAKYGSLSPEARELVIQGRSIYNSICATCHGADGRGVPTKLAPPLVGRGMQASNRKNAQIRIVLHGLTGPVNGVTYTEPMIAMGTNDDAWIASVLSYVRYDLNMAQRAFPGPPNEGFVTRMIVTPEEVKKIRDLHARRDKPWTWVELEKVAEQ
jgi:mono/diheme cytochrome c family protein